MRVCLAFAVLFAILAGCSDVALGGGPGSSGRTLCVDVAYDGSSSDGRETKPFKTIQAAIDAARNGDTIAVAQGRYEHGNIDLKSKAVALLGGYAGGAKGGNKGDFKTRDPKTTPTIVVGSRSTKDYKKDPAAVFLWADSAGGKIDGFTITGGRHGIFTKYTSSKVPLVISNNVIEDNGIDAPQPDELGGGIHTEYKAVVIEDNIVRKNKSGRGGGLAVVGSEGEARIERNLIEGNVAHGDHGGGLYLQQNGVVRSNTFRGNAVEATVVNWMAGVGGGICVVEAKVELSLNVYTDNYAKKCGGGVFIDDGANAVMKNELVVKNRPPHKDGWGGAGIYVDGGGEKTTHLAIEATTVAHNAPVGPGNGNGIFVASRAEVTVKGSIFWANGAGDEFAVVDDTQTSFVAASHSTWKGGGKGVRAGEGQQTKDPLFADPAKLDYHLRSTAGRWDPAADGGKGAWVKDDASSPAIDAGDPGSPFDQEPAPNGGRADLGRYANTKEASLSGPGGGAMPPPPPATSAAPPAGPTTEEPAPAGAEPSRGGCAGCVASGPRGDRGHTQRLPLMVVIVALASTVLVRRRGRTNCSRTPTRTKMSLARRST